MIINLVGECDKRPVIYTLMKIFQTLGDVLLITSDHRLLRLSDTRENEGHYMNTMIAYTVDTVDEFMEQFPYILSDFTHVIVDNVLAGEADATLFCHGLVDSDLEREAVEYFDDVVHIQLYKGKGCLGSTMINCEKFEVLRNMCPINQEVATGVCTAIAKYLKTDAGRLVKIAMSPPSGQSAKPVPVKPAGKFGKR